TSSCQVETPAPFRPWIAVWLNFSDDHLDRHPTVESYAAAKARIFANQRAGDWALLNADDEIVMAHSEGIASQRTLFALSGRVRDGFVVDGEWIVKRTGTRSEQLAP